jgi:hypothetical protein
MFDPSSGGKILSDMQLNLPHGRFEDRNGFLQTINELRFSADKSGIIASQDNFHQQAYDVILGGISKAFDISDEDPHTLEAYDTGHIRIPETGLTKSLLFWRRFLPLRNGSVKMASGFPVGPGSCIPVIVKDDKGTECTHGGDGQVVHVNDRLAACPFNWKGNWQGNLLTALLYDGSEEP